MTTSTAELQYDGIAIPGISHTRLRYSKRARRMRIEVRPDRTLLVVVPARTREDQWLPFVLGRRDWIIKTLEQMPQASADAQAGLPDQIRLLCPGIDYRVHYCSGARNRAEEKNGCLLITSVEGNDARARRSLRNWLVRQARNELGSRLEELSRQTGLPYGRLSIRGQKTRWGSCSHQGNISLNYKLLFMRPELVDHVILHELAHTRHLNHSARFWALLEQHDPATPENRRALRRAGRELPAWLANL